MTISDPNSLYSFFFFNDTATTEIYTLSLHDALPISHRIRRTRREPARAARPRSHGDPGALRGARPAAGSASKDRKSTRLNSSHLVISYAVFCLKKKKATTTCKQVRVDHHHLLNDTLN